MKRGFLIAGLAFLSGCHGHIGDAQQMEALNACTQRWRIEFPDLYGEANEAARRRSLAVMMPDRITFDEQGTFSFEQPPPQQDHYDMRFACRGNIRRRTIESVGHGNIVRRPGQGMAWSF
jgi:hypothetical protein